MRTKDSRSGSRKSDDDLVGRAANPICGPTRNLVRQRYYWVGVLLLLLLYLLPLSALFVKAMGSALNSYILLVPFISGYLLYSQRQQLPSNGPPALGIGATLLAGALILYGTARIGQSANEFPYDDKYLAVMALSLILMSWAFGFLGLGWKWMVSAAFPMCFLLFMVPLPEAAVWWLENALKVASAEAADVLFNIAGVPVLRDGMFFQLPGLVIEVVNECSGIRSTWVLFMTSLLIAHLFLKSPWRKTLLVGFVIPLGIIRNGFRILVIGWLCVNKGADMIESPIHRQGGPIFFVLSLVPLFAVLWGLRVSEKR